MEFHEIYCKECRKITRHEDFGCDMRPDKRYVCIDCLTCNEKTTMIHAPKKPELVKLETTNEQV